MRCDLERFIQAQVLIGPLVQSAPPHPFDPHAEELPQARSAVYIAVDAAGETLYVGSVARESLHSLRRRVEEHLRDQHKATTWAEVWVLPLHDRLSVETVRWAEGRVGRFLKPTDNRRLPRLSKLPPVQLAPRGTAVVVPLG
jgi:hypothetical protein